MFSYKRGAAFLLTAALAITNFIQPTVAGNSSIIDNVCAGAGAIIDSQATLVTEAKRSEFIATVEAISGVESKQQPAMILHKDEPIKEDSVKDDPEAVSISEDTAELSEATESQDTEATVDEEDPLHKLFGDEIIMSNVNDSVNVRQEPDEESERVGKLYHNCAGAKLSEKDGWTQIKSGSVTGWVKNEYIISGQEAVDLAHQVGGLTATVTTDTLRIREEADENSSVYGLLGMGEKIEVTEQTEGWVRVAYSDDTQGYISSEYVSLDYEIDQAESVEEIAAREAKEAEAKKRAEEEAKAAAKAAKDKKAKVDASRTTQTTTTNNGSVAAGADDVTILAALVQAECGNEVYAGKLAVAAVVVNRARGRYGSIKNAVYAPGQFGPAASGKVDAIIAMGPTAECRQAASEAIGGTSNVGAATHFRNIRSGYAGIVIGNHVFW